MKSAPADRRGNEYAGQGQEGGRPPDPSLAREHDRQLRLDLISRLTGAQEALRRAHVELASRGRADEIPQQLLNRIERILFGLRFARYGVRNLFTQAMVLPPQLTQLEELDRTLLQDCSVIDQWLANVSLALDNPRQLPLRVQRLEHAVGSFDRQLAQRQAFITGTR